MELEILTQSENGKELNNQIISLLNKKHAELKAINPKGFLDSFEQSLDTICLDIAKALQAQLIIRNNKYIFNFTSCAI